MQKEIPSIYIVSDSRIILTEIINKLDEFKTYNCITLQRTRDLFHMLQSVQPSIIVIHTLDQYQIVKELELALNQLTPILFLTKKYEQVPFNNSQKVLSFSIPIESAIKSNVLSVNLKSILSFKKQENNIQSSRKKEKWDPNSPLSRYILELDQKRLLLEKVKASLNEICRETDFTTRKQLQKVLNTIKINKQNATKSWEDFKLYFERMNPLFLKHLSSTFPGLTVRDLKYCCYLKMNMSNDDIMQLLGINLESVRTHKYRLKKKLTLPKQKDLKVFIHEFEKDNWVN